MKLKPSEAITHHRPSLAAVVYAWMLAGAGGLLLVLEPSMLRSGFGRGVLVSLLVGLVVLTASIVQSRRELERIARRVEEMEKPGN